MALADGPSPDDWLDEAGQTLEQVTDATLHGRAVRYLFLSGTRSSDGIERGTPGGNKGERVVQLLAQAGEEDEGMSRKTTEFRMVTVMPMRTRFAMPGSARTLRISGG
ncbi:hypothetical protein [Burkholderia plantarii]|uniref:hypothetical protein n=1 Tax=Burkholderia plantarii TaxID=41899 RepID=UPI0018DCC1BC|nr:hypothetical protein [Burkholderia plantarii]MBI0329871.1 hypothetical protein [Burkholderia plantarii]